MKGEKSTVSMTEKRHTRPEIQVFSPASVVLYFPRITKILKMNVSFGSIEIFSVGRREDASAKISEETMRDSR